MIQNANMITFYDTTNTFMARLIKELAQMSFILFYIYIIVLYYLMEVFLLFI